MPNEEVPVLLRSHEVEEMLILALIPQRNWEVMLKLY